MSVDEMEIDAVQPSSEVNPQMLRLYYKRIFPFAEMHKWLAYGNDGKHPACNSAFFGKREFSFTLENDIYLRYLSFRDLAEFEAVVCEKCPQKIDIGAVYNVDPAKRSAYSSGAGDRVFAPVEKELVFDVDMTDYDDVRNCCSGADICLKCWPLMTIAIKILDAALRDDFGFDHLLWVYSGRRGVHCWVCDERARRLTDEQRKAVADYFRVSKGQEKNDKKVALSGPALHPFLLRAYTKVLETYFVNEILVSQTLLDPEEHYEKILALLPAEVATQLRTRWGKQSQPDEVATQSRSRSEKRVLPSNSRRWDELAKTLDAKKFQRRKQEIVFTYTYPRLDLEVSKHMNHLLKAPFCVHPKTGRVCVPIDPENCENFDPTTVPTVAQLLEDLNREEHQEKGSRDWEQTCLAESINFFKASFLAPLMRDCKTRLEATHRQKREARQSVALDW